MKTQKKSLKTGNKKQSINIEKVFERMNELQNVTNACMEVGLESQQFYAILAKEGKKLDRVYVLLPLTPDEIKPVDQNRKYHLTMDIHEIMRVLNETRNMELTCSVLGISPLGVTGLLRRNGFKIGRRYIARPLTDEESAKLEERAESRRLVLLEKKKFTKDPKKKD